MILTTVCWVDKSNRRKGIINSSLNDYMMNLSLLNSR